MRVSQDQFEQMPSALQQLFYKLPSEGQAEVLAGFPETKSGTLTPDMNVKPSSGWSGGSYADRVKSEFHANSGSAARYFYHAKANKNDRAGSKHPTVKPISLMAWLVRMITPPGGTVLDPFAGTGTTAAAAFQEGVRCVLIEREQEYREDIVRRVEALKIEEPKPIRVKRATKPKAPDVADLFSAGHA
jgi:hypothetical protein